MITVTLTLGREQKDSSQNFWALLLSEHGPVSGFHPCKGWGRTQWLYTEVTYITISHLDNNMLAADQRSSTHLQPKPLRRLRQEDHCDLWVLESVVVETVVGILDGSFGISLS